MINNPTLKISGVLLLLLVLCTGRAKADPSVLFNPYITYLAGSPNAVGVGDFNHDGLNDVATSNGAGELQTFLQNAEGNLDSAVAYTAGTRPESLAVGDLNNDGWDDIAVANFSNNTISVFLQQANGTLAAQTTYATGIGPDSLAVGDVNGDGLDDIAVSNWSSSFISIFIQNNSGTLNTRIDYTSPQAGHDDIAIGDVNGDGLNDVVKINGQGVNPDLSVYTQIASGTLSNPVSYSVAGSYFGRGLGIGDVTGDGKADVVMSYGGNKPYAFVAVFAQAGDGTLQSPVSYAEYDAPEALEIADVNEDGLADVIMVHGGWDKTSVHLQQNDGTLGTYSLYALPNNSAGAYKPQALAIGDINKDALPDILVANNNIGLNVLYHVPPASVPPVVTSIVRANASPTNASSVDFTVTFSESVSGVSVDDFALTVTDISDPLIDSVSGSGATYTVAVSTGTGDGTIRLDIPLTATITDLTGNSLSGLSFNSGETYTIDKTIPEMNVKGNNSSIADGDTSTANYTNFGDADIASGTVDHTFTIENIGTISLNLIGTPKIDISGTNASDFSVTVDPAGPIPADGSTTFTVHFDPSATGTRNAIISIVNDDSDENPYNFAIRGRGIASEIDVLGNGVSISNGDATPSFTDHTYFGDLLVASGTVSYTFTIDNLGDENLSLMDAPAKVNVTGANSSDFTVTEQPSSPVLSNRSTTFTVVFDPSGSDLRTASLTIFSNDADENPYTFDIKGVGMPASTPTVWTVTNSNNSGSGSLPQTISDSISGDTITFAPALAGATIHGYPQPITKSIIIDATNLSASLAIDGGESFQPFSVGPGVMVELKGMTLKNSYGSELGGAIHNEGTLTIADCVFSNNSAGAWGGAIYNLGDLTIIDSTFSNNLALGGYGGAIFNNGSTTISNSTFDSNSHYAVYSASGILNITNSTYTRNGVAGIFSSGPSTIKNSTIVGNGGFGIEAGGDLTIDNTIMANNGSMDCYSHYANILSFTGNLVETGNCGTPKVSANPILGPLADNGGLTQTMALQPDSPAINAGDDSTCEAIDQRGIARPQGAHCDIGAYEYVDVIQPTFTSSPTATYTPVLPTATSTPTATFTPSPTPTFTFSPTVTVTPTHTPILPTATSTSTATFTPSPTPTFTFSPTATNTPCSLVIVVANNHDTGVGSLRQAISDVCSGGTITFDASLAEQTINLASTLILYRDVTIDGSALNSKITISGDTDNDGTGDVQVFLIFDDSVTSTLNNLIITKGAGSQGGGGGIYNYGNTTVKNCMLLNNSIGGIYNSFGTLIVTNSTFFDNSSAHIGGGIVSNGGTVAITNSTFSGNSAPNGGGIYNGSAMTIANSTFSDNFASNSNGGGGGIYNGGMLTVTNSTFSGNSAPISNGGGGGIYNSNGTLTVGNSTFSSNSAHYGSGIFNLGTLNYANTIIANSTSGSDCFSPATIATNANNLVEDGSCSASLSGDPKLGPLADSGGLTQTMALLPTSPAINAGDDSTCEATDQRGIARPQGAHCDIGAYEYVDNISLSVSSITRSTTNPTNLSSVDFTVTFSKPVTGVDAADFKLTNTTLTGASIMGVSGADDIYTVTVNTGTGNGTIRLDIPAAATIQDLSGNAFVGPYTSGETYTVYKGTAPTVPILNSPANNALVTSYQPTLDWNNSSQVMALTTLGWHYEINVTAPNGYNETFNTVDDADPLVGLSNSSYTFTSDLPANTTFTWKVRAYNDNNQYSAWSAVRTFRTKPETSATKLNMPVLNLPADTAMLDNKRPTFSWDAVPGTTTYTLQILSGIKVVNTRTIIAPAHTYTSAADLLPGTVYTWKVKANGLVSSDYSASFTFTTSSNPPKVPALSAPVNGALVNGFVAQTLKWNPVLAVTNYPAAASFQLEYATNSAFANSTVEIVNGNTSLLTQLTLPTGTLSPNRTYYWHVCSFSAADAGGNHSAWSTTNSFRTILPTPVLNLPSDGAVEDNKRPTFSWDEVPGATSYTLQILNGTKVVNTGTIKAPAYTYTPKTDLLPDVTYQWKVKANGTNNGDYSTPFTFTTSANPPTIPVLSAPANNVLVDSTVAQVLSWKPVLAVTNTYPAAASYDVEYATNAVFTNNTIVNVAAMQAAPIPLLPGRTYFWRVRSWSEVDAKGMHSAWSAVRTIKVKFVAPVLDSVTVTSGSPTFVWHSANGLWTNYTLTVLNSTTNKVVKSFTVIAPTTTYTIPAALLPAGTYKWQVKINGLYTPISSPVSTFSK